MESLSHLHRLLVCAAVLLLCACSDGLETEPLVEFSTEIKVQGDAPHSLVRQLGAGVYLVEVRERDIDLRVAVGAADFHTELADAYLRHGLHRTVVSLDRPATLKVDLTSIDQRTWNGAAAVRILRWPRTAPDAPPDERLLGFVELGKASALVAEGDRAAWQRSIGPLRAAAEHFRRASDIRSLAESEYQRGWVEFDRLLDFENARRSAGDALEHFRAIDDELSAQRTNLLIALTDANFASERKGGERESRLAAVSTRLAEARRYFEAHDAASDTLKTLVLQAMPDNIRGQPERNEEIYQLVRRRAHARGDRFHEAGAIHNLAYVAFHAGEMRKAASMYESVLPLIERDRNPDLYATIVGNLGFTLLALGDFDRALVLQNEALELFTARGDVSQTARMLSALGSIQFRTGNVERAYDSLRSAQPLYEQSGDLIGQASSLRLMGNAAAAMGEHDLALEHLRRAETIGGDLDTIEGTRVLIAGELRTLGDLRGAEKLLAGVLETRHEPTRAAALAERAKLRRAQHRPADALADLRAADAAYARLQLDFSRIDTSAALALALLDAGDLKGAATAADVAVNTEQQIRVKSSNPELRAGFLSSTYAPYEARIEVDLAGGPPRDPTAVWKAFRTAETVRARSLGDRVSFGAAIRAPRDAETEALRETLTALQLDLERALRTNGQGDSVALELRRRIEATHARIDARSMQSGAVGASTDLRIPESRAEAQAALPADTAVLAYFVGDARSHAWLLSNSELRHAVLPGRRVLQNLVTTFVERQRSGMKSAQDSAFAPLVGNLLDGVTARRLLILPDGPLNGLPFAALPLPPGRRQSRDMLVDRFVLVTAPSLALALRPVPESRPEHLRVAVISDPVYSQHDRRLITATGVVATFRGDEPDDRFARLPYSAIEARAVARAFAGMDVIELAGFNATARRVIELPSQDLNVLHFATHAVTRRDAPEQSALFLSEFSADGAALAKDRLTAEDIARSGLRADLVVLSGCATGDGRELRGEGVLGLTYRFLANGSHTVVASLWPVEDALTARFMEEFYAAYRATGSAPDALRSAQLKLRGTAASAVWSSFVVRTNGVS